MTLKTRREEDGTMGRPLIGKQAIAGFFGTGWRKVIEYITLGAPITRGSNSNSTYEADQQMLEEWWRGHIQKKLDLKTGKKIVFRKTS
ncbi:MAG: hypothetical protein AB1847_11350 [bacterium]